MSGESAVVATPSNKPEGPAFDAAYAAWKTLKQAGHEAYFAGGFARDLLLGRVIHDIDIATGAKPEQVQMLFPDSRAIGKSFGVIQIKSGNHFFDVATFRKDESYEDGRHPGAVRFTTAAEDAQRRDFTINGMFYDPQRHEVVDYVGGLADLSKKSIRAIGEPSVRFSEDHLRILRAVRFASVLGFTLDEQTASAIQSCAPRLSTISHERIRDELERTLLEARKPGAALHLMRKLGLLAVILPEIQAMTGVEQPPEFHPEGDVFVHTALMLDLMQERSTELIWSILMHDVAKPLTFAHTPDKTGKLRITFRGHAEMGAEMARTIMQRFRCPNDRIDAVEIAVRNHMRFAVIPDMKESSVRRWMGAPHFPLEMELHRIDCQASHGILSVYDYVIEFRRKLAAEPVLPPPFLSGKDLVSLGVQPGPAIGELLKESYNRQLEGLFTKRDDALAWAAQQIAQLPDIDKRA